MVLPTLATIFNLQPPKRMYSIYIYQNTVLIIQNITFLIVTTYFLSAKYITEPKRS